MRGVVAAAAKKGRLGVADRPTAATTWVPQRCLCTIDSAAASRARQRSSRSLRSSKRACERARASAGREAASVAKRSAAYLIYGHYSITMLMGFMSQSEKSPILRTDKSNVKHFAKVIEYPCGIMDIVASSEPIFGPAGYEIAGDFSRPMLCQDEPRQRRGEILANAEDVERSMRRARAKVRRIALANDFRYFVTLTLDQQKVDRYDMGQIVRKLNAWCSNMVQRHGLRYVLVPERHKDGAIHFHGFFDDSLEAVDSGTIRLPGSKKPRKPRSKKERSEWLASGGQVVYNLPAWTLGYTTAIQVYGEYPAAVAYVCKYIGKQGDKPAGRWYYSGGQLVDAAVEYVELSPAELAKEYPGRAFVFYPPGKQIAVVNGIKVPNQVQKEE